MHGFVVVINVLALVFYFLALLASRKQNFNLAEDELNTGPKEAMLDNKQNGEPNTERQLVTSA